jgi:hypothetical protein
MTVSELIKQLLSLPQDAIVVTEGYETGLEPVKKVELVNVEENYSKEWWDGKYEKTEKIDALKVVFINSETRTKIK